MEFSLSKVKRDEDEEAKIKNEDEREAFSCFGFNRSRKMRNGYHCSKGKCFQQMKRHSTCCVTTEGFGVDASKVHRLHSVRT